ncbi:MAG: hypothetical protein Q9183_004014 [Haloplaca sp. 2 TL-2023]
MESFAGSKKTRDDKRQSMRKSLEVPASQRSSSPPTPSLPATKTHLLIINGGGHPAFVGDFFALVKFFEQRTTPQFGGEYWTVDDPFTHMTQNGLSDIKFGGDIILSQEEITFTSQSSHQNASYQYVAPADVLDRFETWLAKKYDKAADDRAKPGDSIIIIFLAHGVATQVVGKSAIPRGLQLGTSTLFADKLVAELRNFDRDIQINALSVSCYSGVFTNKLKADAQTNRWFLAAADEQESSWPTPRSPSNRYRNSTFTAGLVRSLGGFVTSPTSPSLQMVKDEVTRACDCHPDLTKRSIPQEYLAGARADQNAISLLFRATADFPVLPLNTAARRRNELDHSYLQRYPTPATPSSLGVSMAVSTIQNQVESFGGGSGGDFHEGHFDSAGYATKPSHLLLVSDVMRGLMWRARHQSNVFQVFMLLCLHGHCQLSSLGLPVNYAIRAKGDLVTWIETALLAFPVMKQLLDPGWKQIKFEHPNAVSWQNFHPPWTWLAVMIARSAKDIHLVFDFIAQSQHLGEVDMEWITELYPFPQTTMPEPNACSTPSDGTGRLGIILPSGVDLQSPNEDFYAVHRLFYERLNKIERSFDAYFQVPEGERLSLDHQQDAEVDVRDWQPPQPLTPGPEMSTEES